MIEEIEETADSRRTRGDKRQREKDREREREEERDRD